MDKERIIIVSEKVGDRIQVPEDLEIPLYLEKDLLECTRKLVQKRGEKNLYLVYFLPLDELPQISSFVNRFKPAEIACTSVVFSEGPLPPLESPLLEVISDLRSTNVSELEMQFLLNKSFAELEKRSKNALRKERHLTGHIDSYHDLQALIDIGKSLTLEKDTDTLLRQILHLSKKITGADAGSIFITEHNAQGNKLLRFRYSHTFSKDLSYEEFIIPFDDSSIAGYVAVSGKVLNIADVYAMDPGAPVSFNRSFDEIHNYRTKSMLVVPMLNHLDQVIGVIQLINCKEAGRNRTGNESFEVLLKDREDFELKVTPFDIRYESLLQAVAGQAAIALENNRMIRQIEHQFDEFVNASVTAIESQDPATSGHSFRVAATCVNLARLLNIQEKGPLAEIQFTGTQIKELEMAALLHDFGKVYINPDIFLKGKKLFPHDYAFLKLRLNFLYRTLQLQYAQVHQEQARETKLSALKEIMLLVDELNKPSVLDIDRNELIGQILDQSKALQAEDLEGNQIPLLVPEEIENFRIPRGTLNKEERLIIEGHVEHTYAFVSRIPWPTEYQQIPEIARKHHEMLNGSGYPEKLKGKDQLPVQARIMAIADIFDALAAADRPYKKALELKRCIDILRNEVTQGRLDGELVELFIREEAYLGKNSPGGA